MLPTFIGRIGVSAWQTTASALRDRLIAAAAQNPSSIHRSAPRLGGGMSDAERKRLTTAGASENSAFVTYNLRSVQRDALDARAARHNAWITALLRSVDDGWDGVNEAVRQTFAAMHGRSDSMARSGRDSYVDVARRLVPPSDVPTSLRVSVQQDAQALLACPSALWGDLADGRSLPTVSSVALWEIEKWHPAFVVANLNHLSTAHQAPAPWRGADCVPSSPRGSRLIAAWTGMTAAARVAPAMAQPWTLATVAVAARLGSSEPSIAETRRQATAAAVDTLETLAQRDVPDAAGGEPSGACSRGSADGGLG